MILKSVKIGGYTIKIQYVPHMVSDSAACGQYIPRLKIIQIDPSSCEEQQYATFMHELVEAITEIYELPSLTQNHHDIILLGEVLHQILRDNPKIMPDNEGLN